MKVLTNKNPKKLELIDPSNGIWAVRWNIKSENESYDSCDQKTFNHKPSLREIYKCLVNSFNEECSFNIENSFVWNGNNVYLNQENQHNIIAICSAANINNDILPVLIKFGTYEDTYYYEFTDLSELNNFYAAMGEHISNCLKDCWNNKSNINLEEYK